MSTNNSKSKIAVVGAGAIGSLIGGLLWNAGEDVTLIARPAHTAAIQANGLLVHGKSGELNIPIKACETLDIQPDLVLLAVKTQDVEAACQQIKPFIGETPVVTLQNGVRSDEIASTLIPRENIISGVVMLNAQYLNPGEIIYARSGTLVIGEAFGPNRERTTNIQVTLNRGIHTVLSDNIHGAHWTKLLVNNLGNGLESMMGMTIGDCLQHPGMKKIGIITMRESKRVIDKAGFQMAALPGVPPTALRLLLRAPMPVATWILSQSMGKLQTLSSTLQSLRRGRPTEIDYLNGEVVRLGNQVGMDTPINRIVVEMVKEVEKNKRFYTPEEVLKRFPNL